MSRTFNTAVLCTLLSVAVLSSTGCVSGLGVSLGVAGIPIPVSPYHQKLQEDKFWNHERYERVPILGPITAGGPAIALDAPSDDEIMRAFERASPQQGGIPMLHEIQRNNVRITKVLIADYIDEPRVVPLIGPVQLHHAHYKCTVSYTEVTRVGWPIPYTTVDQEAVEVLYIDHNHFHMVGNVDTGKDSNY